MHFLSQEHSFANCCISHAPMPDRGFAARHIWQGILPPVVSTPRTAFWVGVGWMGARIFYFLWKSILFGENVLWVAFKKINQFTDDVIFRYRIFLVLYQKFWYKPGFVSNVLIQNTCDAFCSAVAVQNKSFSHDSLKSGKRRLWTFQITKEFLKRFIRTKVILIRVNCSLFEIQGSEWFFQYTIAGSAAAQLRVILLW